MACAQTGSGKTVSPFPAHVLPALTVTFFELGFLPKELESLVGLKFEDDISELSYILY